MAALTPARLQFADDGITPFAPDYGDVYHSAHGGPAQVRHVFLGGNQLPERWQGRDRFVILETGFGLGLNFLATWAAWRKDPQRARSLHFVSFEKHPFTVNDLKTAQSAWPEFADQAAELQAQWPILTPGMHRIFLDGHQVVLTLIFGDATTQLRAVNASVDAFFLDGFSPATNPEMWSPEICRALSRLAAPGATLATWSVAGSVRRSLIAAEFDVEKRPGFAGKRQMLFGRLRSRRPDRHQAPAERRAIVIGAGIAGCVTAARLVAAGWQVTVFEQAAGPASGASCNLAGVLRPLPSADDSKLSRLTRAGYLATRQLLNSLPDARWSACGVVHLGRDSEHEKQQKKAVDRLQMPPALMQYENADTASKRLGLELETGGWWFPNGGWVNPASVCKAALDSHPAIQVHYGVHVAQISPSPAGWQLSDTDACPIGCAPVLILAAGAGASDFSQFSPLPQRPARGQVTHLPAGSCKPLSHVVCRNGYAMPEIDGIHLIGASLQLGDTGLDERNADHRENIERVGSALPGLLNPPYPANLSGRVGLRPMSPDRMPIVGPLPDFTRIKGSPRLSALPRQPGLWCVQGFGARGIVWSALMADLLVSWIEGQPLPIENDLVEAVDPGRFLVKAAGRQQQDDGFDDRT